MTTVLLYLGLAALAFALFSRTSLFESLIKPFLAIFEKFVEIVFISFFGWWLWMIKAIWRSHVEFFTHLFSDESEYDLELMMKEKARK